MIVVSDTSPINYLVQVEADHLLPDLYGEAIIPTAVHVELQHAKAPVRVREWIGNPPNWLRIQKPSHVESSLKLDPGEIEAISLAKELRADHLLIDEREGTKVAIVEGLRPLSTLSVLVQGAEHELIDLPHALNRLQNETTFRASQRLIEHVLAKYRSEGGRS